MSITDFQLFLDEYFWLHSELHQDNLLTYFSPSGKKLFTMALVEHNSQWHITSLRPEIEMLTICPGSQLPLEQFEGRESLLI